MLIRPDYSQLSTYEKVLLHVAPGHLEKRMVHQAKIGMMSSSYDGASQTKKSMKLWNPGGESAATETEHELEPLRNRSRDLIKNNPIAAGVIGSATTNIIGTGIKMKPSIDRDLLGLNEEQATKLEDIIEREWKLYAESVEIDAARTSNFYEQQSIVFNQYLSNGDSFTVFPFFKRKGSYYSTKLKNIEADRVDTPTGMGIDDNIYNGVEVDKHGAPQYYYINKNHPGDRTFCVDDFHKVRAFDEYGLPNVLHLFNKTREGQVRGVPYLAPVIEPLKQLSRLTEANLTAAVIASFFTVFIKSETGKATVEGVFDDDDNNLDVGNSDKELILGSGLIQQLAAGQEIEIADPKLPNDSFDPFFQAILMQIGIALQLPYEILTKRFQSSYSAAKGAMHEAWKYFRTERFYFIERFCKPSYRRWMWEAVALGKIPAPGFFDDPLVEQAYLKAVWIGDPKGTLDEDREISAASKRISENMSTATDEAISLYGKDYEDNLKTKSREKKLRKKYLGDEGDETDAIQNS